eukprot:10075476-Alexandrium_andersonii.AAC.1
MEGPTPQGKPSRICPFRTIRGALYFRSFNRPGLPWKQVAASAARWNHLLGYGRGVSRPRRATKKGVHRHQ